jgi:hypothetical protein
LSRLEPSDFPQSFSGKIEKHLNVLVAPTSGKNCVYYRTVCEEEVEKTRHITRDGKKEIQVYYDWVQKFVHEESVDFILVDPENPNAKVFIPLTGITVKSQSTVDAFKKNYQRGSNYPHHLTVRMLINKLIVINLHVIIFAAHHRTLWCTQHGSHEIP